MSRALTCTIPSETKKYEIEIRHGGLDTMANDLKTVASKCAIITDDIVLPLYGTALQKSLSSSGLESYIFSFPHGEQNKTRSTKEYLEERMVEQELGRDCCVAALGGGVVTDMAGYIAATYCRGVPLIMIPTSLLGMVDASIGGKTAVNGRYGKNMFGCIYQPKKVLIDTKTLSSLPKKELANGIVEMVKHALIADAPFFAYLESRSQQLLSLEPSVVESSIFNSCLIKKKIVEEDEREQGKRRLLNFGHTVGHALEAVSNYTLSHGHAVAIGLLVESHIARQLGTLQPGVLDRIKQILQQYDVPVSLPHRFSTESIINAMTRDKKALSGQPRFTILKDIGSPLSCESSYCMHVDAPIIQHALEWMNDALCCN